MFFVNNNNNNNRIKTAVNLSISDVSRFHHFRKKNKGILGNAKHFEFCAADDFFFHGSRKVLSRRLFSLI